MTLADGTFTPHHPRRAWTAVVLLAVLAEPIKEDLALSDTAIGVINGFWFLAVYAVLGLVIARIADRGAFGLVISTCLALWGAMTMLGGAVQSAFQLAMTRVQVAVGRALLIVPVAQVVAIICYLVASRRFVTEMVASDVGL